ncbi:MULTISPECIES: hypothetical protein [unclassified Bradyrhizobium]|uniref:hypothetical protein n=1 Tax=unclassified Bradyrhizobium TaxID=2631580 RepID=UPI00247AC573|nr:MULTISPECIES: hypothetical protein [unclassified Bradyrhizobium]WGR74486.1 hypothetical protein MTX24_17345 [Bradyrhizobium sp. ISRA426]WGR79321.1 hypothetical protein MTX21_02460 [Bradyrhizobium sp. ISRA430]WGR89658.1 hypothetical protein MTX25_17025 [Bradyrhizobium sp. ISRA432]
MPIFRYFMFVGGALLALLLAANFIWPTPAATSGIASASNDPPLIRIRSDRHLPERVVLDTSKPTIAPPVVQAAAVAAPQPAQANASPGLNEMSAKARVRETFAQFIPPGSKAEATSVKKTDAKAQASVQSKRRVARARPAQFARPMMLVAQQPHFGFFNTTW